MQNSLAAVLTPGGCIINILLIVTTKLLQNRIVQKAIIGVSFHLLVDSGVCIQAQWDHSRCATETGPRGLRPTCGSRYYYNVDQSHFGTTIKTVLILRIVIYSRKRFQCLVINSFDQINLLF